MYIIAVYDVHHKRVTKVRKVFKKYLKSTIFCDFQAKMLQK